MSGDPARSYAQWYERPRGAWIGQREFALLRDLLDIGPDESVLDVGSGTGYFTHRFAAETRGLVAGLDPDEAWTRYAARTSPAAHWVIGSGGRLPFPDASFDVTIAVTSLCFMSHPEEAVSEMVRVTRRRVGIGLLNRRSLLWREKGRGSSQGSYGGARWHDATEARELMGAHALRDIRVRTAVFLPSGSGGSRLAERLIPSRLPWGGFLAVVGDV